MKSNLEQNPTAGPPAFAWWADHMAESYRLATAATLFPGLAAMRYLRLFFADVARDDPPPGPPEKVPNDLEELRAAWQEFEENKGDWSKSR
jgi:hypothetical protein